MHVVEAAGWFLGTASGIGFFLVARSSLPGLAGPVLSWGGLGAIGLVVLGWLLGLRRSRAKRLA